MIKKKQAGSKKMIIYFSGTGNSRFAAEYIAEKVGDQLIDAGDHIKRKKIFRTSGDRPLVFVCPVYAFRMPRFFEKFIRRCSYEGNMNAYFVMTCGGGMGNAFVYNEALCKDLGFKYMGTMEVVMPDNYLLMDKPPQKDEAIRKIRKALPDLDIAAKIIRLGGMFPENKAGAVSKLLTKAANPMFNKFMAKAKNFRADERCIGCGKCEQVCVLNNITMKDGRPSWGDRCSHCMACISYCPAGAIEYGKKTVGRVRYTYPDKSEIFSQD